MVSFESFKEKALATAGKVAEKSVSFAKSAGEKAKVLGKITKLKTEIAMEKDAVRKTFVEIGKMYYEKHKDNPDPDMAQAVEEITLSLQEVEEKKAEVEALKKELADQFHESMEEVEREVKAEEVVEGVAEVIEKAEHE